MLNACQCQTVNAFDKLFWCLGSESTNYSQKEKFPQITRPDGLIEKNPCNNATNSFCFKNSTEIFLD